MNKALVFVGAVFLFLTACGQAPPPVNEAAQVAKFERQLQERFTLDKTMNDKGEAVTYVHAESNNETKTRKVTTTTKVNGKTKTVVKNKKVEVKTRVIEGVIVLAGNCKLEFEVLVTDADLSMAWLDETRRPDGSELKLDSFNPDEYALPKLEPYFRERRTEFAWCLDKPVGVSPPERD